MAEHVIHISEEEAARDFAGLMARVRAGAEVVIESDSHPTAVLRSAAPPTGPSPSPSRWPKRTPKNWATSR